MMIGLIFRLFLQRDALQTWCMLLAVLSDRVSVSLFIISNQIKFILYKNKVHNITVHKNYI